MRACISSCLDAGLLEDHPPGLDPIPSEELSSYAAQHWFSHFTEYAKTNKRTRSHVTLLSAMCSKRNLSHPSRSFNRMGAKNPFKADTARNHSCPIAVNLFQVSSLPLFWYFHRPNAIGNVETLRYVVRSGNAALLALLLRAEDYKEVFDASNITPEMESLFQDALTRGHSSITEHLVWRMTLFWHSNRSIHSPPLKAALSECRFATFKALLSYPRTELDSTELVDAASKGYTEIVRILLAHPHVDVGVQTTHYSTPLIAAASNGHASVVQVLLEDARFIGEEIAGRDGLGALMDAMRNGHVTVVRTLIKHQITADEIFEDHFSSMVLERAAHWGNWEIVQILLADPRLDACARGATGGRMLLAAAAEGHAEVVAGLVRLPFMDVNARGYEGNTALHVAAQNQHAEVVKVLLAVPSIDTRIRNDSGRKALHEIAWKRLPQVKELLRAHRRSH